MLFWQNLLYILKKKEKARIKFMNFIQKYMGSIFLVGSPCISNLNNVTVNAAFYGVMYAMIISIIK